LDLVTGEIAAERSEASRENILQQKLNKNPNRTCNTRKLSRSACSSVAQAGPSSAGRSRKDSPDAEPRDMRLPLAPILLAQSLRVPLVAAEPSVAEPYPDTLQTDVYSTSSVPGKAR
jgi:hypothetical protein